MFIQHTPEDTLKSPWFLIRINHKLAHELNMEPDTKGCDNITSFHIIPLVKNYVMTIYVDDHYGMNIF